MKLIIDIHEDDYRHIKEYYEKNDIVEATYSYIYHGIPLACIKADIEEERIGYPPSADYYKAISKALYIIDKHIGKRSDKE